MVQLLVEQSESLLLGREPGGEIGRHEDQRMNETGRHRPGDGIACDDVIGNAGKV